MPGTPSAPAPATPPAPPTEKPKRTQVSDEEALNIAFNEFCSVLAKHGGAVFVYPPDPDGQMVLRVRGAERVEPIGSKTVTLKFKDATNAPTAKPSVVSAPVSPPK